MREFSLDHGHDPSNWSRIEREILPLPRDEETLRGWARQLGLKQGPDDWLIRPVDPQVPFRLGSSP